jgi:hypothetical protein
LIKKHRFSKCGSFTIFILLLHYLGYYTPLVKNQAAAIHQSGEPSDVTYAGEM